MRPLPSPLLAIADGDVLGRNLVERAEAAVLGGVQWLCLRMKGRSEAECRETSEALRRRCPGAVLSLNGDLGAAEAEGLGVHLPSRGHSVAAVRERFPAALLGVSCHGRGEIEAAWRQGADYVLLSPLFPPMSKPSRGDELGREGFRRESAGLPLPVLAMGGIDVERLPAAAEAGAAGAAVLGALFLAPDVERRARELCRAAREVFGQ